MILTPDWLEHVVALSGFGLTKLRLQRPSTVDLVLTKMMRVDPEDRDDVQFLLRQPECQPAGLRFALSRAVIPPVAEIQAAFAENRRWLQTLGV